jgi:hypothetical protein
LIEAGLPEPSGLGREKHGRCGSVLLHHTTLHLVSFSLSGLYYGNAPQWEESAWLLDSGKITAELERPEMERSVTITREKK